MKKTYIILFGAALLLGSCTRNPEIGEPTPPHASSGLVIKASCTPATRTDIIEGKSTWEVGDRITVVSKLNKLRVLAEMPELVF